MKEINKLPTFMKKRILVVVSHPDDECLYFYGGLKALSKVSTVTILSVTQAAWTTRGLELISFCKSLQLQCDFLNLPDRGIQSTLPDFQEDFENYYCQNNFDLIITHPPHGGEKPHPHHLQTLLTVFSHCLKHSVKFAFFSESHGSLCEPTRMNSLMRLRITPLLILYVTQTLNHLKWRYKPHWFHLLFKNLFKIVLELKIKRKLFVRFEIESPVEEKKRALQKYATQKSVLASYQTVSSDHEYLFLLSSFRISKNGSSIGTENLTKNYHQFKVSTTFQIGPF